MTYSQIVALLSKIPCPSIEKRNEINVDQNRNKRDVPAGGIDIYALQTTINDHRTMINYLINNSINATFVADVINNHHSRTGPILTSWRDFANLFFLILVLIICIYLSLCRAGFTPCDNALSFVFRPVTTRLQQQ